MLKKNIFFKQFFFTMCSSAEFQAVCSGGIGITTDGRGNPFFFTKKYYFIHVYLQHCLNYIWWSLRHQWVRLGPRYLPEWYMWEPQRKLPLQLQYWLRIWHEWKELHGWVCISFQSFALWQGDKMSFCKVRVHRCLKAAVTISALRLVKVK